MLNVAIVNLSFLSLNFSFRSGQDVYFCLTIHKMPMFSFHTSRQWSCHTRSTHVQQYYNNVVLWNVFYRKNYRVLYCSFSVLREMLREYIFTHDYSRPELSLSSSSSVLLKLTKADLILSVHFLSQRNERRAICLISWDPYEIAIMKYW